MTRELEATGLFDKKQIKTIIDMNKRILDKRLKSGAMEKNEVYELVEKMLKNLHIERDGGNAVINSEAAQTQEANYKQSINLSNDYNGLGKTNKNSIGNVESAGYPAVKQKTLPILKLIIKQLSLNVNNRNQLNKLNIDEIVNNKNDYLPNKAIKTNQGTFNIVFNSKNDISHFIEGNDNLKRTKRGLLIRQVVFDNLKSLLNTATFNKITNDNGKHSSVNNWLYLTNNITINGVDYEVLFELKNNNNATNNNDYSLYNMKLFKKQNANNNKQNVNVYHQTPDSYEPNIIQIEKEKQKDGNYRGKITFTKEGKTIINLYQRSDASTVIHEMQHFFYRLTEKMAENGDEQAINDLKTIEKWTSEGVKAIGQEDNYLNRFEYFARSFEGYIYGTDTQYLNKEVKGVFERLKTYLKNVYDSIVSLNIKPSKEVKDFFDYWIGQSDLREKTIEAREKANYENAKQIINKPINDITEKDIYDIESIDALNELKEKLPEGDERIKTIEQHILTLQQLRQEKTEIINEIDETEKEVIEKGEELEKEEVETANQSEIKTLLNNKPTIEIKDKVDAMSRIKYEKQVNLDNNDYNNDYIDVKLSDIKNDLIKQFGKQETTFKDKKVFISNH
ncbi:MAG: hypothetical protein LBC92_01985, partial [Rickettsiales bacterium]|nr:hypothetical protein [Rickettsiales bacterium]